MFERSKGKFRRFTVIASFSMLLFIAGSAAVEAYQISSCDSNGDWDIWIFDDRTGRLTAHIHGGGGIIPVCNGVHGFPPSI